MVESKIITNRFNFLVENRKFETDEDLKLFMEDYIAEVSYLRTQGYDSKVIEEAAGLFATLSSIFGLVKRSVAPLMYWRSLSSRRSKRYGHFVKSPSGRETSPG